MAGLPHLKKTIKRQIETTDQEINTLVYRLYGLTSDEIDIVEKRVPPAD